MPGSKLCRETQDACETIDASLFTGDEFMTNHQRRFELHDYCARWTRKLDELAADDPPIEG